MPTFSPSDTQPNRGEEIHFLESLDQPSTSRGNRPPPINIEELCESFSEASLAPSVREYSHRSKLPGFNSPDRYDIEIESGSDTDEDPRTRDSPSPQSED